jgi:hypothetical protein
LLEQKPFVPADFREIVPFWNGQNHSAHVVRGESIRAPLRCATSRRRKEEFFSALYGTAEAVP